MNILVVIPTYDEIENINAIVRAVVEQELSHQIHVLVVDDNSPDGTAAEAKRLVEEFQGRVFLLERERKEGLGKAYVAGFRWAMERSYSAVCEMDADFSHDPKHLGSILHEIEKADFVVGSRYVPGGGVTGWGPIRKVISRGGSLYARIILQTPFHDMTGGFNCWRRSVLQALDLDSLTSAGYCFQIELKYRAWQLGFTWAEVPILFEDRREGASKMTKKIVLEAIWKVWSLKLGGRARAN